MQRSELVRTLTGGQGHGNGDADTEEGRGPQTAMATSSRVLCPGRPVLSLETGAGRD